MAKARARGPVPEPISVARIETALAFMAYVVKNHGDRYAPIMRRLAAELQAARLQESSQQMADRILATYTLDGGVKAIR